MVAVGRYHIRLRKSFARICPATRGYVFRVRMARSLRSHCWGQGRLSCRSSSGLASRMPTHFSACSAAIALRRVGLPFLLPLFRLRDFQTTSAKTCTPFEMLHGIGEVVCESPHQQESPRGAWQDIPVLPFPRYRKNGNSCQLFQLVVEISGCAVPLNGKTAISCQLFRLAA